MRVGESQAKKRGSIHQRDDFEQDGQEMSICPEFLSCSGET